jgi:putative AlgH/UPF0301 family transcriptional regulator
MNRLPSDQTRENQGNSEKVLLTGSLLAASPWAREPNFRNSVCLIV